MSPRSLQRFHSAQADAHDGYPTALAEIRTTGKRSHWIWYIFPQLVGLGYSSESRRYGIAGRAEAQAYLEDVRLRARLLEITTAVVKRLEQGWSLPKIMGSAIDAQKLVSSLTLFEQVSREMPAGAAAAEYAAMSEVAERVLVGAAAQGYLRCPFTTRELER